MTDEYLTIHLNLRRAKMKQFIAEPQKFKVCDTCRSISFVTASICRVCHAYRWDFSVEGVVETAKIIGENAFPQTSGTVPRL